MARPTLLQGRYEELEKRILKEYKAERLPPISAVRICDQLDMSIVEFTSTIEWMLAKKGRRYSIKRYFTSSNIKSWGRSQWRFLPCSGQDGDISVSTTPDIRKASDESVERVEKGVKLSCTVPITHKELVFNLKMSHMGVSNSLAQLLKTGKIHIVKTHGSAKWYIHHENLANYKRIRNNSEIKGKITYNDLFRRLDPRYIGNDI